MINSIPHLIQKNKSKFYNKKIIFDENRFITYQNFAEESIQVSHYLRKLGYKKNDRIGIYMSKNINQSLAICGCLFSGFIFVPILPKLNDASIKHIIKDCNMKAIISDQTKILEIKKYSFLTQIINFKKIFQYINNSKNIKNTKIVLNIKKNDIASIIYSSGSTGRPKGIVIPHINFVEGAKIVSKYLKTKKNDNIAGVLSLNFDYGLNQLWQTLLLGCSLFFHELIFANDFFLFLKKRKISALPLMPVMVYLIFNGGLSKRFVQSARTVKYVCSSGGPISTLMINNLKKTFIKSKIYLMYGLTEAFRSTYLEPNLIDKKSKSIGKAIPTVKIDVLNKNLERCKIGEIGELVHRGGCISLGYWNDAKNTKKVFRKYKGERAVFSGDYVKKDSSNNLYFVGRKDHMIKTAGYRVSPSEIEDELMKIKEIKNIVIFGVADKNIGQSIVCSYTAKKKINHSKLNRFCKLNLPTHMNPKKFYFFNSFPITGNQGKLNKNQIITHTLKIIDNDKN